MPDESAVGSKDLHILAFACSCDADNALAAHHLNVSMRDSLGLADANGLTLSLCETADFVGRKEEPSLCRGGIGVVETGT